MKCRFYFLPSTWYSFAFMPGESIAIVSEIVIAKLTFEFSKQKLENDIMYWSNDPKYNIA
ncbi:hypothetical protein ASG33_08250 [Dyadobacter sp. Leaf189]|nr:hypothetical protein ASG33_08250 [Dyadobacter sp. Leaf189]